MCGGRKLCRPGGLSNDSPDNLGGLYVAKEDTLLGIDSDPGRSISRDKVLIALHLAQPKQPWVKVLLL